MKTPALRLSRTFIHCSAASVLVTLLACKSTPDRASSAAEPPATKDLFFFDTFPDVKDVPKLDPAGLQSSGSRGVMKMAQAYAAERLIKTLPKPLAVSLTEVYFIYNERWYLSCEPPKPQPLVAASSEARRHYLEIADYALQSLPPSDVLREQVDATHSALLDEQNHFVND